MVRPAEPPAADVALERLCACVLAVVSRQLVRAGKAPLAPGPGAQVGLLTCRKQVGVNLAMKKCRQNTASTLYSCLLNSNDFRKGSTNNNENRSGSCCRSYNYNTSSKSSYISNISSNTYNSIRSKGFPASPV